MRQESENSIKKYLRSPDVIFQESTRVEEALEALRTSGRRTKTIYFYVVDAGGKLLGTVSSRSLLTAKLQVKMEEIMDSSIIYLQEEESLDKARDLLLRHRLLALPVINEGGLLQGVIDIQVCLEEEVDLLKEQRKQDIFQLIGVTQAEILHRNPFRSYTERMPWIFCNMIGGIACAGISLIFRDILAKALVLAMFIPLVLSISESISMQSMTHSFQILRRKNLSYRKIFLQMFLEMRVAILMSWTSGLLVGAISLFWDKAWGVSLVIAIGIFLSVIFSAMLGSFIPLFLHMRKLDPKVASGPIVLTLADIVTTAIYFTSSAHILL
ncbi:MAG: magnesium transporter [Chlamydiae bacterium]|nr:magnesium transporter [Chlamydiota bacterium]